MTAEKNTHFPLIGIVTVLYNSDDVLEGFFSSLATQVDVKYRLYVIDNSPACSGTDLAVKYVKHYGMQAEFLFNNANVGVARGNNQGIEMALHDQCDYVLLANNDTEFLPVTISTLLDSIHGKEDSIATPKILYHGTDSLIWYAGGAIDRWTIRVPHFGMLAKDIPGKKYPHYTEYAPTCFMLIRASIFAQIGMMDEAFFVYYDDTDFVWRFADHNLRIRLVSESVVQHKVSTSTGGGMSPFSVFYTNRNRIYFARKNLSPFNRFVALGYMALTRLLVILRMPQPLRSKIWSGIKEGFRMEVKK